MWFVVLPHASWNSRRGRSAAVQSARVATQIEARPRARPGLLQRLRWPLWGQWAVEIAVLGEGARPAAWPV